MTDIDVHVRLRKCCREKLADIDQRKKKAHFERGLLAAPSLLGIFGEKPVDQARELVPSGSNASGGTTVPHYSKLQKVTLRTCRTICEMHAEKHAGPGENLEATFWRELALGLERIDAA